MTAATDLRGRHVTVVGLGRFGGGIGVTRWLCGRGAIVTVSDQAPADALAASVAKLAGLDVMLHLGGHDPRDFTDAELLVVSPAVPDEMPLLAAARDAGVEITTEINLFLRRCPAPIVGVTGTVGKSTTTAMIGEILATTYTTHVGGNIGGSLLESLEAIQPGHVVVLELSSFQLERTPAVGVSPRVAVVTNLAPNHLDRHKTFDSYADAKKNLFRFQRTDDVLVLPARDETLATWAHEAPGRVTYFDPTAAPFELDVPGRHNQANAQAAWTTAREFDVPRPVAGEALKAFPGLAHRLQFVAERNGVRYYNDSKCTTPEGAIVALNAFSERTAVLIVGGSDKGVRFDALGAALADRAKAVIALGATRQRILDALLANRRGHVPAARRAENLADAVAQARSLAAPGDAVVLSPACASFDMFVNYEQRGETFISLVRSERAPAR